MCGCAAQISFIDNGMDSTGQCSPSNGGCPFNYYYSLSPLNGTGNATSNATSTSSTSTGTGLVNTGIVNFGPFNAGAPNTAQSLSYAWPLTFTLTQPAQETVTYYSYVVIQGTSANPAATPFTLPTRIPMMILRDPPGEGAWGEGAGQARPMGHCTSSRWGLPARPV